ncbi:hypothetical protein GCM10020254_26100 [Streptomyces goshikiensis]
MPASALERLILPSRVAGYSPALLDELTTTGEVVWAGAGALPGKDGWISLYLAEAAPLLLPAPHPLELTELHQTVLDTLSGGTGCSSASSSRRPAPAIRRPPIRSWPRPSGIWPGRGG